MKALPIMILVSLLISTQSFHPQMLVSADSIDMLTSKKTYVPGETIEIIGHSLPNVVIHIDLVSPLNSTNSTQVQTDDTGRFHKNILIPYNVVNGSWVILATSGIHRVGQFITILSSNYVNLNSTSALPVNASAIAYSRNHPNLPYHYFKYYGTDLEIKATAYNPINLFGNVTDPNGKVHQMSIVTSEKGIAELRFYASVSDPNGSYAARIQLIKGPTTSDLNVTGESKNYQKPVGYPALQPPPPMSPKKQIANGILPENVICYSDLVLVKKLSDNSPACVKPLIAQKLVERGWGVLNEQTAWFEYTPLQCQQTPWDEHWNKLESARNMTSLMYRGPELGVIKMYFKDQGITILDARQDVTADTSIQRPCGQSASFVYYFLIPQSDSDKMTKLGFAILTTPLPADTISVH